MGHSPYLPNSPLLVHQKKIKVDSERKDMEQYTMFSQKIIKLTCSTVIKIQHSGQTNSVQVYHAMQIRTWWNIPALFLSQSIRSTQTQTIPWAQPYRPPVELILNFILHKLFSKKLDMFRYRPRIKLHLQLQLKKKLERICYLTAQYSILVTVFVQLRKQHIQ